MNAISEDFKSWLLNCVGRNLVQVFGAFHVFEGGKNEFPQAVSLLFDEGNFGTLECASDGSSIAYRPNAAVGRDLGEYGVEQILSLSNEAQFLPLMGRMLISVSLLESSIEDSIVGVAFNFFEFESIALVNLGDDLNIYKEVPQQIMSCQGIKFVPLASRPK